jgi:RNA ligase (TIGR02306 family)
MSETPIEVVVVKDVLPHPQAARLDVIKVLDTQFVTAKGDFRPGDLCIYFPPDMLIPNIVGEVLGIANYLKHAVYPGDLEKSKCRIGAIRLRGVASFGFGISTHTLPLICSWNKCTEGTDVTEVFSGVKYQPRATLRGGDSMRQPEVFHKYTDIQHYYRHASAIPAGTSVRITEKIHGTNSRVGYVRDDGLEFMCGTHYRRVKPEDTHGRASLYWTPLTGDMKKMLEDVRLYGMGDVIVFGEIYGNRISAMDYATPCGKGYRVFDISTNGDYLDWELVKAVCERFQIKTVPLLYEGPFSPELVDKFISGPTTLADPEKIRGKFKGREGVVITPLKEQWSEQLNGRLILKAVSPDYYESGQ